MHMCHSAVSLCVVYILLDLSESYLLRFKSESVVALATFHEIVVVAT